MEKIFDEIKAERKAQDEQWGGPEHDDGHSWFDFLRFIRKQNCLAENEHEKTFNTEKLIGMARARFVKIAALAVAAIESIDRTNQ